MLRISDVIGHPAPACGRWRSILPLFANFSFDSKAFLDPLPNCILAAKYEKEEYSSEKVVTASNSENYFKGVILAGIWFNGR